MFRRFLGVVVDVGCLAGTFTLLTGGLRTRHHPLFGDLSLMYFGPYFLPLALCLAFDFKAEGSRALRWVRAWIERFDALPERSQRLWTVATIAVALLTHLLFILLRYYSFQSSMDLAIYANACRGALYSTMKGDVWLFADHFEPLLILFTPLCRAFSPAVSLLIGQTICWGIGTYGIYRLARQRGYRPALAWLVAMLYLNFTGNVTIAYYDFHLLSLALGLLPWMWWAVAAERYGWLVVLSLAYLGLKESAAVSLIGFGAFLAFTKNRKQRIVGLSFVLLGAVTFVLIMKVVYPAFRGGEGTMYFAKYYGHLGKDLPEFLHTAITRPGYFLYHLLRPTKLEYITALLFPFLFFALRYPLYLLPVLPAILINILSNNPNLIGATYHYEAEIYPALFAMAVIAFTNTQWRAVWLTTLLVLFTAQSTLGLSRWNLPTRDQRNLQKFLAQHVPHDRAIAAPQRIAAHLTDRPKLYMFDYWGMEDDWKRADLVVVGFHSNSMGWYNWKILQNKKLPRMRPYLKQVYQEPSDPRFQVFEVLPSAATAPTIASPGATAEHAEGDEEPDQPELLYRSDAAKGGDSG
jgi:uncharacterized membrane protein